MENILTYKLTISPKTRLLNFFRRFFIITGLDKQLSKFTQNKTYDCFFVKLIPPNYLYPKHTRRAALINELKFETDISDSMEHFVYYGTKDPAENKLFGLVRPGMAIIDVGANVGRTALNFAKLTGDNGMVHAFEPDLFNYKRARHNFSLNRFSHLFLHNKGLGCEKSTAFLHNVNEANRGMLRILPPGGDNINFESSSISLTSLDAFMVEEHLPTLHLVKIDVEGYELEVLKGGSQTLKKFQPLLFIEVDDRNLREQHATPAELITFLQKMGYTVQEAISGKMLHSASVLDGCHIDVICKPVTPFATTFADNLSAA